MQKTIKVNNIDIWTETFGHYKDEAIILISGAMAPATFWPEPFCNRLAQSGYFVIRFDNRDMGYSTHFPACRPDSKRKLPYSIYDMVKDIKSILNYFDKKQSHIIGHSLGGVLAQLFAVEYPAKTLSLIPISSPILAKGDLKFIETDKKILDEMWSVLMSNAMYPDFERGKNEFLKVWKFLNGDWELDKNMADAYTKRIYATEKIEPAWNHTLVQKDICDILEQLKKLKITVLILYGEKDHLAANPYNVRLLANHLENANLYLIPGTGHMFFNKELWHIILNQIIKIL